MKYSKERIDKIVEAIKTLKGRVRACKEGGISYETFTEWMANKIEFAEAIKKAEEYATIRGKEHAILSIFKAMETQWQAAAWWLERNFKEEFALKNTLEMSGKDGGPILIALEKETAKILAELYNAT